MKARPGEKTAAGTRKAPVLWGPWTFALVKQSLGSSRLAILSLIFFFIAGLVLLYFVDVKRAQEARNSPLFEKGA